MGKLNISTISNLHVISHEQLIDFQSARCAAERGDANAQFILGECYSKGEGVKKDYERAAYWYRKAALHSVNFAYRNFASPNGDNVDAEKNKKQSEYKNGERVKQDYEKTSEQGDADAQFSLGLSYYNGQGVERDDKQAVYWFWKAAEQGHADAQYHLGFCYKNGFSVKKDDEQAVYWFRKAAEQGHARAQYHLDGYS